MLNTSAKPKNKSNDKKSVNIAVKQEKKHDGNTSIKKVENILLFFSFFFTFIFML